MIEEYDPSLAIVVLAAGGASRFGSPKQLAEYQGKTLLQRAIDTCSGISGCSTYVVLGAEHRKIAATLDSARIEILGNNNWQNGISSSIHLAVTSIGKQFDGLMFLAADQPLVGAVQVHSLIDTWQKQPDHLVAAKFSNKVGIPAIYPKSFYSELLKIKGDRGGKRILLENKNHLLTVAMPQAAIDIDYPDELDSLKKV